MNPLPISESELHAYIDGLLPESRCAEIERYLSTHPEEAERVRIYREQMQAIRTLFGPSLDEAIPRWLIEAARTPPKRQAQGNGHDGYHCCRSSAWRPASPSPSSARRPAGSGAA